MAIDLDRYERFGGIKIETHQDDVLDVVFSDPETMNSISARGHAELVDIWPEISRDPEVRAVLVRGEGRAFSSGGDFAVIHELINSAPARLRGLRETRDIVYNLINCTKPVVSAMQGVAVGAGLVVGLLSDISIVTPDVKLIDGHTKFGIPAGDHAALIWPLLIGIAKAKYHVLLCEPMIGREAERMGLVSLCVEADQLIPKAREITKRLAEGSQMALELTKYSMNNWLRQAGPIFDASLGFEILGLTGEDVLEGVTALQEKRPAKFK